MKLVIPEKVLDQHMVMLGKTGAGKSSALRHIVEHLLEKRKRVCIVDPKGDWYGLKSSADGQSAGYPVIAFGDFREPKAQDVPINEHSGKHVAELVATGNRPCIIGFRGWMTGPMVRFWIDFASTLFNRNAGELYLVGDEFHNFAPKGKIMDPEAGKCLHWSNRLLAEGRGLGIVCLLASQRPQKVHNDTLTACETLAAMRVVHAADRDAVKAWIEGCGDPEMGKKVLASLAGMARGEAYVWSPEIGFGPELVKFPMFTTFDSFAPPQLQKKVHASGWAEVNLDEVKAKLADVVEEAKAKDPAELKKQIAELKKQLAAKPSAAPVTKEVEKRVEVPALKEAEIKRLEAVAEKLKLVSLDTATDAAKITNALAEFTRTMQKKTASLPQRTSIHQVFNRVRKIEATAKLPDGGEGIGNSGKRRILIALAQNPNGLTKTKLSIVTGISQSGGTWRTYLGELRGRGYVEDLSGDQLRITNDGLQALGDYDPLPVGRDLVAYWQRELGDSGKRRIFDVVLAAYPESVSYEHVEEQTGIAVAGGTFRTYVGELRGLELVTGKGSLRAADVFFEGNDNVDEQQNSMD
jgi:energy-coupling factor transporter ATP-binding protein EcfA2